MRVLHVVTLVDEANSYGGPLTVALNQCRELRRRGHDAIIVAGWAGAGTPPTELEGVPAKLFAVRRWVPGPRFSGLVSLALLCWLQRRARAVDVAHIHLARDLVPLLAATVLSRAGVPFVTQTHGMVTPDARSAAELLDVALTRPVLRRASVRFVLTDRERADLSAVLASDRAHPTLLPNGVPASRVARPARGPDASLDVLFLARLHPRKRVLHFAEAAQTVARSFPDTSVRFSVVGADDGDLARFNEFLAMNSDARQVVTYEGPLPHAHVAARLAAADLYVLPSVDEPFPMSILEALAVGTPAICTSSCGLAGPLADAGAVIVVDETPDALAAAITVLLNDPTARSAVARRGRDTVAGRFSMEAVVEQLESEYAAAMCSTARYQPT